MPAQVHVNVVRYLQAMIPVWYRIDQTLRQGQRPKGGDLISRRQAAEIIGVKSSVLSGVIRRGLGVGPDFEAKIAKQQFHGNVQKLRDAADRWAAEHPETPGQAAARRGLVEREAPREPEPSAPKPPSKTRPRARPKPSR